MSETTFDRLREGDNRLDNPTPTTRSSGGYGFSNGTGSNFGQRPGYQSPSSAPSQHQNQAARPQEPPRIVRMSNGDRPSAWESPPSTHQRQAEGQLPEFRPPTFQDVLMDLGLRVFEVAVAAAASAAGNEIAYFFQQRRFHRTPPR